MGLSDLPAFLRKHQPKGVRLREDEAATLADLIADAVDVLESAKVDDGPPDERAWRRFFDAMRERLGHGRLTQQQVDGALILVGTMQQMGVKLHEMAYILATAWHETAFTLQPIEEYGRGRGHAYGKPDPSTGHAYYGRGYVQLTWRDNYERAGRKLGIDLVNHPEKALEPATAAAILISGMREGWFTGQRLDQHVGSERVDYYGARRVVNGLDKASQIAGYAEEFETALVAMQAGS